jgi:BNR repeat-containing family member
MRARAIHRLLIAGLALVAGFGAHASPAGAETVPYRMDASNQAGWWHPMDTRGATTYVAYNGWGSSRHGGHDDTHRVYVSRRDRAGRWSRGCLLRRVSPTRSCAVYPDDVGHNQPTLIVDGDGYIHVFASMHHNNWRYFRSSRPGDPTTMVERSAQMPDQGGRYTYPTATRTPNGDVYVGIRSGRSGVLHRWNDAADQWSRVATFAAEADYAVYPDDLVSDSAGNVHIAWEWAYGSANGLRHLGSYMRYEPRTRRFFDAADRRVTVPAGLDSSTVYQPLEGAERSTDRGSPADPPGLQTAKLALDPDTGRPVVAYRFRPRWGGLFEVRLAEWRGSEAGGWVRKTVYGGPHNTYAAVDVTRRAGVTRVYYAKSGVLNRGQAAVATRGAAGTWTETPLATGMPVERLSVVNAGGVDHLYLAAPSTYRLSIARRG